MKFTFVWLMCLNLINPDLSVYRKLLDSSLLSERTANQFYEQFRDVNEDAAPVILGFKAMSEFMMSKHLLNPFSRIGHFNRGKKLLEMAIQKDHTSAELLFFRLTTQSNVPSILKYSSNINSDKLHLISYLQNNEGQFQADKELYKRIKNYLLVNQHCSTEERTLIEAL
jgi:hypothetical protein